MVIEKNNLVYYYSENNNIILRCRVDSVKDCCNYQLLELSTLVKGEWFPYNDNGITEFFSFSVYLSKKTAKKDIENNIISHIERYKEYITKSKNSIAHHKDSIKVQESIIKNYEEMLNKIHKL